MKRANGCSQRRCCHYSIHPSTNLKRKSIPMLSSGPDVGLWIVNGGRAPPLTDKTFLGGSVVISTEAILGLPGYQITGIEEKGGEVRISARYTGPISCPHCGGVRLRVKDRRLRSPRHESWGQRPTVLLLETRKWQCRDCGRTFWQRFPGLLPRRRATEPFRRSVFVRHWDGINRRRLGRREGIGSATVERWFQDFIRREAAERSGAPCPQVLGRSEAALDGYLQRLPGKDGVRVVCMDLASAYRALVRKHFPNARIVADRFHVLRLINH